MKKTILFILIWGLIFGSLLSQEVKEEYLGQIPPGIKPKQLQISDYFSIKDNI